MAKTAVLVFFYFGEKSYMNRLAQETVPVGKALEGYDKAILLRHKTEVEGYDLSPKAAALADVEDLPTRENFVKYLDQLGKEGFTVDVFIFSHGLTDRFTTSKGEYGQNRPIRAPYIEEHVAPLNLRMVWQCNCYGSSLNDTWKKLGAKVTAGSRFVNFYPTRFRGFIKRWNKGVAFGTAITKSDTKMSHAPVQGYMLIDAVDRLEKWNGKIRQVPSILSRRSAAKQYFEGCWLDPGEWFEGKSGRQNMNMSSHMIVLGDRKITKSSV